MTRALALLLLLPSLASAQKASLTIDQTGPVAVECIAAVPESVKPVLTKGDAVEAYKIITVEDEKDAVKLAASLGYDLVSCAAPVTIASRTSKITVTTKALPGECAPVGSDCRYTPPGQDGKAGVEVIAPNDLTFPAGTLVGCKIPPVRKVLVELFGKTSMPDACRAAKVVKGEVDPKVEVVK